jgi:hypothetical protein
VFRVLTGTRERRGEKISPPLKEGERKERTGLLLAIQSKKK